MFGAVRKLSVSYAEHCKRMPLWSKVWTSSFLSVVGDVIAQGIEHASGLTSPEIIMVTDEAIVEELAHEQSFTKPIKIGDFTWDHMRSWRMATFGAVFIGPFFHGWFGFLEKIAPGFTPKAIVTKVAVDQLFAAPFVGGAFFLGMGLLEGKNPEQIKQKFEKEYVRTLTTNYMVWPLAQFVNFGLMPQEYRTLFVNIIGVGWRTYLSMAAARQYSHHHPHGTETLSDK